MNAERRVTSKPQSTSWTEQLAELKAKGLGRTLRRLDSPQGAYVTIDGRRLCCFSSNNYLGLANHPHVIEAVRQAVAQWGWGSGASQLVTGYMGPHAELAARLAAFKKTEAALLTSTGYQANLVAVRGLVGGRQHIVLIDKLVHASIVDAALGSEAIVRVFPHRDYAKLERLLERTAHYPRRVIVTDSVFSMDGDCADLPRLVGLKHKYDALLCVDEAHATGVLGEHGRGLAEAMGVENEIDLVVGTLSKALGGIGGFVCGPRDLIDWLINSAGAFIYTTAPPPAACAAAMVALDLVEQEPWRRKKVLAMAHRLRQELGEIRKLDIAGCTSQIVPLVVGEPEAAIRLSAALEREGLLVTAIRPPTVPRGRARLRISLTADHEPADLDHLLAALGRHLPTR